MKQLLPHQSRSLSSSSPLHSHLDSFHGHRRTPPTPAHSPSPSPSPTSSFSAPPSSTAPTSLCARQPPSSSLVGAPLSLSSPNADNPPPAVDLPISPAPLLLPPRSSDPQPASATTQPPAPLLVSRSQSFHGRAHHLPPRRHLPCLNSGALFSLATAPSPEKHPNSISRTCLPILELSLELLHFHPPPMAADFSVRRSPQRDRDLCSAITPRQHLSIELHISISSPLPHDAMPDLRISPPVKCPTRFPSNHQFVVAFCCAHRVFDRMFQPILHR